MSEVSPERDDDGRAPERRTAQDLLADAALFTGVASHLRLTCAEAGTLRQLAPGERLLAAGDGNASLFIVLEGDLDVRLPGMETPQVELGPGECVGELSVLDHRPVSADVVASSGAVVLELDQRHVWTLIDSSATFARNLLRVLAGRIRHDNALLAESSGARRHYEHLSVIDSLTAIHNRRWFDTAFRQHVLRLQRDERGGALLLADVDRFKTLNDEHGHATGDDVLKRVALALASGLRDDDLLARFGGEEFAVLVTDVDDPTAHEIGERLRQLVAAPPADGLPPCTVSIGIALVTAEERFETLVARADAALFRAKQVGRNCISA